MCGLPERLTERYTIDILDRNERELVSRVEKHVVGHPKRLLEYQASDVLQEVKAGALVFEYRQNSGMSLRQVDGAVSN